VSDEDVFASSAAAQALAARGRSTRSKETGGSGRKIRRRLSAAGAAMGAPASREMIANCSKATAPNSIWRLCILALVTEPIPNCPIETPGFKPTSAALHALGKPYCGATGPGARMNWSGFCERIMNYGARAPLGEIGGFENRAGIEPSRRRNRRPAQQVWQSGEQ